MALHRETVTIVAAAAPRPSHRHGEARRRHRAGDAAVTAEAGDDPAARRAPARGPPGPAAGARLPRLATLRPAGAVPAAAAAAATALVLRLTGAADRGTSGAAAAAAAGGGRPRDPPGGKGKAVEAAAAPATATATATATAATAAAAAAAAVVVVITAAAGPDLLWRRLRGAAAAAARIAIGIGVEATGVPIGDHDRRRRRRRRRLDRGLPHRGAGPRTGTGTGLAAGAVAAHPGECSFFLGCSFPGRTQPVALSSRLVLCPFQQRLSRERPFNAEFRHRHGGGFRGLKSLVPAAACVRTIGKTGQRVFSRIGRVHTYVCSLSGAVADMFVSVKLQIVEFACLLLSVS